MPEQKRQQEAVSRTPARNDSPVRIRYIFDEPLFLRLHHALWQRQRRKTAVRWRGIVALALLPAAIVLGWRYGMWLTAAAMLGFGLLHFVLDWPITRAVARRQFVSSPVANHRFDWRVDESGLSLALNGRSRMRIDWSDVSCVVEHGDGFLLAGHGNAHYWLPRNAFLEAADIARLRRFASRFCKLETCS